MYRSGQDKGPVVNVTRSAFLDIRVYFIECLFVSMLIVALLLVTAKYSACALANRSILISEGTH